MEILDRLGYAPENTPKENHAWRMARFHLRENKILFLHIDDCQHVLHTLAEYQIQKFSDTLKNLMIDLRWPIQIILSGTPELVKFIERDTQLKERLSYVNFEPLSLKDDGGFVETTLKSYAKKVGLKLSMSPADALIARLMHAGQYRLGLTIEIAIGAIRSALAAQQGTLSIEDFAVAYGSRVLSPDLNPFLAREWDRIECKYIEKKPEIGPVPPAGSIVRHRRAR
jgi:hypothetical protein